MKQESRKKKKETRKGKVVFILLLSSCFLLPSLIHAEDRQLPAAIHVHSNRSSGLRTISEIAKIAEEQGIEAVVMTDLLAERYEYGLRPFEKVIKKTIERDSLQKWGMERYFR